MYIYIHVYSFLRVFKLKSACIIRNIYFHYLLLSKTNIILSSKCTIFQMPKKFRNDATYYQSQLQST